MATLAPPATEGNARSFVERIRGRFADATRWLLAYPVGPGRADVPPGGEADEQAHRGLAGRRPREKPSFGVSLASAARVGMLSPMKDYRLYYWPTLPGRGELVRLVLEDAGADYVDVARLPDEQGGGFSSILRFYEGERVGNPVMAPPFLEAGDVIIGQTHVICDYLGEKLALAPEREPERLYVRQAHLTLLDLTDEAHDTHHPLGVSLYYEDHKEAARVRALQFLETRLPRFVAYFERLLARGSGRWLVGDRCTYADLTAFQVVEGLRYAFPNGFEEVASEAPRLLELRDRVADRPRLSAYLASDRRLPFNEDGIFRHYPELDAPG